jgi:hypothetical protein
MMPGPTPKFLNSLLGPGTPGLNEVEVIVEITGRQALFRGVRSPRLFPDQGNGAVTEWVSRL